MGTPAQGGMRVTMFFSMDQATWSESWWVPAASGYESLLNADGTISPLLNGVIQGRVDLLATPAEMTEVRISDPGAPRTSQYVNEVLIPETTPFGGQDLASDRPYSVVLLQEIAVTNEVGRLFMGGVPDTDIGEQDNTKRGWRPQSSWFNKLGAYLKKLISLNVAFRHLPYLNALQVQTVVSNGPAGTPLGFTTLAQIPFAPNGPFSVAFRGARKVNTRVPGLNGTHKLALPLPTAPVANLWTYYLLTGNPAAATNLQALPIVAPLVYTFPVLASLRVLGATHRKRGATQTAPRGRSRTRV